MINTHEFTIQPGTLCELFSYDDWGNDKLTASSAKLSDDQLDRPFEMGEGSLRATLHHIWAAERVWLDRWLPGREAHYAAKPNGVSIPELRDRLQSAALERNEFLTAQTAESLAKSITYTNSKGQTYTFRLGDMMLHVINHGTHHRAQAVNMMRHLGAELPKPGPDYIFMKLQQQQLSEPPPAPPLDVPTIRAFFTFADWSRGRTHDTAARLTDAQLDRPFEIGIGTLRKTLLHIRFAEQWWLDNWTTTPAPFPEINDKISIAELDQLSTQTAQRRNEVLAKMKDADLTRLIEARPRPDIKRIFPIGVTMLQLCNHGSHHRAQALNMLRHVGAEIPAIDYLEWIRARQLAQ